MKKILAIILIFAIVSNFCGVSLAAETAKAASQSPSPAASANKNSSVDKKTDSTTAKPALKSGGAIKTNNNQQRDEPPPAVVNSLLFNSPKSFSQPIKNNSFQSNLFTGQANYSVNIEVPPGRSNLTPSISLGYTSGAPNSLLGVGWDLNLGSIERTTRFGVPKYDETDTLVLSLPGIGSGDLVSLGSNNYSLKRINQFIKIKYDTSTSSWIITDKNNTKYYFGQAVDSKMTTAYGIFHWALDKIIDNHSNEIIFNYQSGGEGNINIYPQSIEYTKKPDQTYLHKVEFVYETDPVIRTDAFLSYRSKGKLLIDKRLNQIQVKTNDQLVRSYNLTYAQDSLTNQSLLHTVQETGNQGGSLPAIEFSYEVPISSSFQTPVSWGTFDYYDSTLNHLAVIDSGTNQRSGLIDMNGDGLPDKVVRPTYTTWDIWLNNGSGFETTHLTWTIDSGPEYAYVKSSTCSWPGELLQQLDLVDMNGDGLPDRVWSGGDRSWYVALNNFYVENAGKQNLLGSISNGYGATTDLSYEHFNLYNPEVQNPNTKLSSPTWVLTQSAIAPLVGSPTLTTAYAYTNGSYDYTNKEFAGFGNSTLTDPEGFIHKYQFDQSYLLRGKPTSVKDYESDGTTLRKENIKNWEAEASQTNPGAYLIELIRDTVRTGRWTGGK